MKGVMTMKKRVVKLCFLFFFIVLSSCFKDDTGIIQNFIAYPNPFSALKDNHITFKTTFKTTDITEYQWTLNIYTENGNLTYTSSNTVTAVASPLIINWPARDNAGHVVSSGIYTAIIRLEVTKYSVGYSAGTYQDRCYTVIH